MPEACCWDVLVLDVGRIHVVLCMCFITARQRVKMLADDRSHGRTKEAENADACGYEYM